MSTTFFLATIDADGNSFVVSCPDREAHRECKVIDPSHAEDLLHYGMCDCVMAAEDACSFCNSRVNMNETNARAVVERLGLGWDYCGAISAEDLLGRALVGNVGRDDSGIAGVQTSERMFSGGVSAGYFTHRLGQLADLAAMAVERNLGISWG